MSFDNNFGDIAGYDGRYRGDKRKSGKREIIQSYAREKRLIESLNDEILLSEFEQRPRDSFRIKDDGGVVLKLKSLDEEFDAGFNINESPKFENNNLTAELERKKAAWEDGKLTQLKESKKLSHPRLLKSIDPWETGYGSEFAIASYRAEEGAEKLFEWAIKDLEDWQVKLVSGDTKINYRRSKAKLFW